MYDIFELFIFEKRAFSSSVVFKLFAFFVTYSDSPSEPIKFQIGGNITRFRRNILKRTLENAIFRGSQSKTNNLNENQSEIC